jgi:glycosyltransferase involved in cell wall biosynthesis
MYAKALEVFLKDPPYGTKDAELKKQVSKSMVDLITTEQKKKDFRYYVPDKVIHIDLNINYDRNKSYFHPKNLLKLPKHIVLIINFLKKIKPNFLVVCNHTSDSYFLSLMSNNLITIKEFHFSRYNYYLNDTFQKKIRRKFEEFVYKRYNYLVTLNEDEKKTFKSDNVVVIPNSIKSTKEEFSEQRKKNILAAGRIAPVKQFDHLIKAWHKIASKYQDWQVHIYGDGDDLLLQKLKNLAIELGVQNSFIFKGATSELDNKMKEASIFALTSQSESFSLVLVEAIKNGLPIVSYDCPYGPRNIIKDGKDGILVELNNIELFSEKISFLIDNEKLRKNMGKNALINSKNYEVNRVMRIWQKKVFHD